MICIVVFFEGFNHNLDKSQKTKGRNKEVTLRDAKGRQAARGEGERFKGLRTRVRTSLLFRNYITSSPVETIVHLGYRSF